jgi:cellulose synthase/poly-beta-1,6-N-acetylglucosamine synthase-like glycosyltransferase
VKWVFWSAAVIIAYTYFGYPAWLWIRSWLRPRPVQRAPYMPHVSMVMVVRNEEKVLRRKLENLLGLNYPAELREIVVVSDGSTDGTNEILAEYGRQAGVHVILNPEAKGKACGLNDAIGLARGEVVVFTDARQEIEAGALHLLMENLADPAVGCVSGELMLGYPASGESGRGVGLYWRVEKKVREMESAGGSVVGATGALYAVRRELLAPLPPGTILDDVYLPMNVVRQGKRVIFEDQARAWDSPNLGEKREFTRKVRTLSGNYQLLQIAPWLLGNRNPLRFEFVSHKLLRLLGPFVLVAALVSCASLEQGMYRVFWWTQIGFYGLSVLALMPVKLGPLGRLASAASTFVVLNAAAAMAFANFVTRRKAVWVR